jgi:DNA-binding Lrp family transcriptional regulator
MSLKDLDDLDKQIITELQKDFPLVEEPFKKLAGTFNLTEADYTARLQKLKDLKILRQISGIFDTRNLGYQSTLVASRVDSAHLEEAARIVNQHPGVSHNYRRSDNFNMWYTLAVPPDQSLEGTVNKLHELSGATSTHIMPTLYLYKIGVQLNLTDKKENSGGSPKSFTQEDRAGNRPPLTPLDIEYIRVLQEDLPLVSRPFKKIGETKGYSEADVIQKAKDFVTQGYARRFAAVIHHRNAGFTANAMVVWVVPKEERDRVGRIMGGFSEISHCYERPTYPDWPYSLFTMIHGRTTKDCEAVVAKIVEKAGDYSRKFLYSTTEFKKIRLKYFLPELTAWWKKHKDITRQELMSRPQDSLKVTA